MAKQNSHILPLEPFIDLLKREGFFVDSRTYFEVMAVWENYGYESQLKNFPNLIKPLLVKNQEEGIKFDKLYHQFFKLHDFHPKVEDIAGNSEDDFPIKEEKLKAKQTSSDRRDWMTTGIFVLSLTIVISVNYLLISTNFHVGQFILFNLIFLLFINVWRDFQREGPISRLIKKQTPKTPPYIYLPPISIKVDSLFPRNEILHAASPFRRQGSLSVNTAQIDLDRTISQTISNGGRIEVSYQKRGRIPEYVILIDETYQRTFETLWFEHIVELLIENGIHADYYFYQDNPDYIWKTGQEAFELESLPSNRRLIIFGQSEALVDYIDGGLYAWAEELIARWERVGILSPKYLQKWGYYEETLAQYAIVAPARLEGIASLINAFDGVKETEWWEWILKKEPSILQYPEPDLLYRDLPLALFYWICACAIYPQVEWKLALRLGQALEEFDKAYKVLVPGYISKITRIPWFREGKIPDDQRKLLINALPEELEKHLRKTLEAIMDSATDTPPPDSYAAHNLKVFEYTNRLALSEDPNEKNILLKEIAKLDRESEVKGDQVLREDVEKALEEKRSWKRIRELGVRNLRRLLPELNFKNVFSGDSSREEKILKDLPPYFSEDSVRHALEFYIETKGQNIAPSREQDSSRSSVVTKYQSLIDYFLFNFGNITSSDRFTFVLGDSGMGKTTFLINLYARYLKQGPQENGYQIKLFPLGYPGIDENLKKLVESREDRNTILLLDGFDEDPKAIKDYKSRLDELVGLIKNFRRIIITCRTQFFPDEENLPGDINVSKPGAQIPTFHRFKLMYISPFDQNDIAKYLEKRFPGRSNRGRRLKAQSIIERAPKLMVQPMLLSLINDFFEKNSHSFELVSEIYAHLIDEWIRKEGGRKPKSIRNTFEKELKRFSQRLSLYLFALWQSESRIFIKGEELRDFLQEFDFELSELEFRSQSLFNRDAEGNLKFAHKSIWEFFLAEQIFERQKINEGDSLFRKLLESELDLAKQFFEELGGVFPDEVYEPRGFNIPNYKEDSGIRSAKNYFLGIGIDQYQHVAKLSNAVRDTRMISEVLSEKYGFEDQQLLFDENATRRGIRSILRNQINRVSNQDNLIIYYSGQGHFNRILRDAYWVPVDARYGDDTDYVSYDFIQKCIRNINAHHIFLIVDSCYSGAIMVRKKDEPLQRFENVPSRWILASGRNEAVFDGNSGGGSPFATQLLNVLNRYVGEEIRVSELVNKVTTGMIYDSFQTPIGRPLIQVGDMGGEFVFRRKGSPKTDILQQDLVSWNKNKTQELKPFRQLLEAENQAHYISKEEYDDLIEILEDIEESPQPTDRQKRRWKKKLGKAVTTMRKFIGGRVEIATDTVIQEEVKDWLKKGGLEALMDFLFKISYKDVYKFYAPVGSLNPDNKGNITQHIDQRTLTQELNPVKQLIEAERTSGFITREEYEELIEILAEIQEDYEAPKPRQKKRWLRWLAKAKESGQKFLGGRLEKGIDTVIQEELKDWYEKGGFDTLIDMVNRL